MTRFYPRENQRKSPEEDGAFKRAVKRFVSVELHHLMGRDLASGAVITSPAFGASAGATAALQFHNGASASASLDYSGFQENFNIFSGRVRLNIPIN